MLPLFSLRIAARRVPIAPAFVRTLGVNSRWTPSALTRSFITTVVRAEPAAKAQAKAAPKTKKAAPKKTVRAKKPVKKVVKKKPAKKADAKLSIPRGTKIPSSGPSPYIYFFTKVFLSNRKMHGMNFQEYSKAAGEAWSALSDADKQANISTALRVKAKEERVAYTNALDPKILKEMNRRRVAKGKNKVHKTRTAQTGRPLNAYMRWVSMIFPLPVLTVGDRFTLKYRASHPTIKAVDSVKAAAAAWNATSAEERKPYIAEFDAAMAEWNAKKQSAEA
ncbi:hypothetical protein C0991_007757 [Blastosporella zonata]|nr:hypothetical protein C0991_007757 [Blastosporella zonata]